MILNIAPWRMFKMVYDRCRPVGMGMLQFQPGDMTAEEAMAQVAAQAGPNGLKDVSMDYVNGRQCKFHFKVLDTEQIEIDDEHWHDHTKEELDALIKDANGMVECSKVIGEHLQPCLKYLTDAYEAGTLKGSAKSSEYVKEEEWETVYMAAKLGIPLEGYPLSLFNAFVFGLCDLYTSVPNPGEAFPSTLPLLKEICEQAYIELSTITY